MKKPVKKNRQDNVDLRRWCVEQAMRWPVYEDKSYGAQGGLGAAAIYTQNGGQIVRTPADVVERAERLRAWVLAAQ